MAATRKATDSPYIKRPTAAMPAPYRVHHPTSSAPTASEPADANRFIPAHAGNRSGLSVIAASRPVQPFFQPTQVLPQFADILLDGLDFVFSLGEHPQDPADLGADGQPCALGKTGGGVDHRQDAVAEQADRADLARSGRGGR